MSENVLAELYKTIIERKNASSERSYTAKLFRKGQNEILKKIGEESTELVMAAAKKERHGIIYESADLLYHLLVLLASEDIDLKEVLNELASRSGISGIDEKASRGKK